MKRCLNSAHSPDPRIAFKAFYIFTTAQRMVIFIFLYGLFVKCEKAAETYLCVYSHWFQLRPVELETNLPVKFTIPEKLLTRAFSCFKAPISVFTFKMAVLRHYIVINPLVPLSLMTFASASLFHIYLLWVNTLLA